MMIMDDDDDGDDVLHLGGGTRCRRRGRCPHSRSRLGYSCPHGHREAVNRAHQWFSMAVRMLMSFAVSRDCQPPVRLTLLLFPLLRMLYFLFSLSLLRSSTLTRFLSKIVIVPRRSL